MDRTDELLLRNLPDPPSFQESIIGRVQAYTMGYTHDFATGFGAQLTVYSTPESLRAQYGSHPVGGLVFLRVTPFGKEH